MTECFIPNNEQGTIFYFAQHIANSPFKIVEIRTQFPDAIILYNDDKIAVEFEYRSSNFILHKHDIRQCDMVICWKKDCELPIPIVELSTHGWTTKKYNLGSDESKEIFFWKRKAMLLQKSLDTMKLLAEGDTLEEIEFLSSQERRQQMSTLINSTYVGEKINKINQSALGRQYNVSHTTIGRDLQWLIENEFIIIENRIIKEVSNE